MLYSDREKLEDVSCRLRRLMVHASPEVTAKLGALASELDGVVSRTAVAPIIDPEGLKVVLVAMPYAMVPPELRPSLETLGWTVTEAFPYRGWVRMEPPPAAGR